MLMNSVPPPTSKPAGCRVGQFSQLSPPVKWRMKALRGGFPPSVRFSFSIFKHFCFLVSWQGRKLNCFMGRELIECTVREGHWSNRLPYYRTVSSASAYRVYSTIHTSRIGRRIIRRSTEYLLAWYRMSAVC